MQLSTNQRAPLSVETRDVGGQPTAPTDPPAITSSDPAVAEIIPPHVYGRSPGSAQLVAVADGVSSAPLQVDVVSAAVASVILTAGPVETGPFQ
jgi:hypothetical protein